MPPEALLLRACLALVTAASFGLWLLRDGTRMSDWLDRIDPCPDLSIGDE